MNATNPARQGPRLSLVVLFAIAVAVATWVGHQFGDAIGGTFRAMWNDLRGERTAVAPDERIFTCGMHPSVLVRGPGLCPLCQMELTPVDPTRLSNEVVIDPRIAQNIGVRTAIVGTGPLVRTLRTVGKVDYDETLLRDVSLKVAGWIERLHVDFLGATVHAGDALCELYSPELLTAQQEYLIALRGGEAALASSRRRLELLDIDAAQIEELARRGEVARTLTIRSKSDGVVILKSAVEGMRAEPGMRLFRIAGLGRVWVEVTVYEFQLPFVELGQPATMTLGYLPGQEFNGKVTWIQPWLDERTREVLVRLEFDNADGLLKPGMFASVALTRTLAQERTLLPRSAVLDTGQRQVGFVSLGDGHFVPRTLRLGVETDGGMVEVLDGVKPGESIVVSAQFLLDSESRLREAMLRMVRDGIDSAPKPRSDAELTTAPPELASHLTSALRAYAAIADALVRDAMPPPDAARDLAAALDAAIRLEFANAPDFWSRHDEVATARGRALELVAATDLEQARRTFADLSIALGKLLRATGVPAELGVALEELHCPMYLEDQGGGLWLQGPADARNPYFGARMLRCFDRRERLPTMPHATPSADDPLLRSGIDAVVDGYLAVASLLLDDRIDGIDARLGSLRADLARIDAADREPIRGLVKNVLGAVPKDGLDLVQARAAFAPLSTALIALLRVEPSSRALVRAHCPMVEASWLQIGPKVANPYMGSDMPECGSVEETMPEAKQR